MAFFVHRPWFEIFFLSICLEICDFSNLGRLKRCYIDMMQHPALAVSSRNVFSGSKVLLFLLAINVNHQSSSFFIVETLSFRYFMRFEIVNNEL